MNQNPLSETQPSISSEQLEPQPLTPTTASTNWSKTLLFVVLGLIVVSGAVYGGFYIGKKQVSDEELIIVQEEKTENPTEDWKTYANKEYGFEIKHPSIYRITQDHAWKNAVTILYKGGQSYDLIIEFWDNPSDYQTTRNADLERLVIYPVNYGYLTLLNNNNDLEVDQILSTFKFINQDTNNKISNWETFIHPNNEYQLLVPPNFSNLLVNKNNPSVEYFSTKSIGSSMEMGVDGIFVSVENITAQHFKDLYSEIFSSKIGSQLKSFAAIYTKTEETVIDGYSSVKFSAYWDGETATEPAYVIGYLINTPQGFYKIDLLTNRKEFTEQSQSIIDNIAKSFQLI